MTSETDFNLDCWKQRWVAYFDLLGMQRHVQESPAISIFCTLDEANEEFYRQRGFDQNVERLWFSDTYIFFSQDDSAASFASLEATSRHFFLSLVQKGIPLRGAMAFGKLYVDKENDIFFGKALVEAYRFGEHQDWIGFLLTPSAEAQMETVKLPARERIYYRRSKIPWKTNCEKDSEDQGHYPENLFVCEFQNRGAGRDFCLKALSQMEERSEVDGIKRKYQNTLGFIRGYSKKRVDDNSG
jgi:hypothetical protein